MIKLTDFFARGGVSPTCRTRRLALNLWNYTSWLLMWPSSLLTSVQPKGAEHNRVPDVCTTQSDQICQVELIWPVPIWSQTNCCWWKYCSLSTKTLCCSRGKLWPPLPVLVKLFLGKLVQHPMAPHEWERRKHCTALSDTHTHLWPLV